MVAVRTDGGLLLMSMLPLHVSHLAEAVPAAGIGEAGVVRPLRVQRRTGAVHLPSVLRSIGTAQPLRALHRPEALRWALRVAAVVC